MSILAGRYELERRLGGGGMAEVFLARLVGKDGFSRQVAIKRVLAHLATDESFAKMFVAEAQMCAKLQHPNIVSVLDFDRDEEGRPFLVIELVDGPSLAELADAGPLPIAAAMHVATELLRGLAYAHDLPSGEGDGVRGIVHRDISPHNVLLSWEGAVKLSDFGIAKARAASGVTASELLKGKPAYMSPEQANGEALDGRSDLFSVGIVLWELLVGRTLFSGHTTQETLARVLFAPVPSPRSIRGEVPADVDAVVMKLLARETSDRYADANDAVAALVACKDFPRDGREKLVALLADRFAANAPQRARASADVSTVRAYAPTLPAPRDATRASSRPWLLVLGAVTLTSIAVAVTVIALGRREPSTTPAPTPAPVVASVDAAIVDAAMADALALVVSDAPLDATIDATIDARSTDPKRVARAAIANKMAASPTNRAAFSFAYARLFDPMTFYAASKKEAQRLFGDVSPGLVVWKEIDASGKIDSTSGGLARNVFVAKTPADGYRCVELGVERGAAYARLADDELCDEAGETPACTPKQLYELAVAAGLPSSERLDASMARLRRWQLGGETLVTHHPNNCANTSKSPSEEERIAERAKIVAASKGRGAVAFPPADEKSVDPSAYFERAWAEARRVLGGSPHVWTLSLQHIRSDGRIDATNRGHLTIVFGLAAPTKDGFQCMKFWSNPRDTPSRFWMSLVKSVDVCNSHKEGAAVPRCTGAELYRRAVDLGLPTGSEFAARLESGEWVLTQIEGTFRATSANDCH